MSEDWGNQPPQPYSTGYYPHTSAHEQYIQPQLHPHQVSYPGQAAVPTIDPNQYHPYPQAPPQSYPYIQQGQPPPESMHTRTSSRNLAVDPNFAHHQNVYGQPMGDNSSRTRPTRSGANYGQPPLPPAGPPAQRTSRAPRVNYKEEPNDGFDPNQDDLTYGMMGSHPQAQSTTQYYEAHGTYVEQSVGQNQQQVQAVAAKYEASTNGGAAPAHAVASKNDPNEEEEEELLITTRGRVTKRRHLIESSGEEDDEPQKRRLKRRGNDDFIASDNDDDKAVDDEDHTFGDRPGRLTRGKATKLSDQRPHSRNKSSKSSKKRSSTKKRSHDDSEADYVDEDGEAETSDPDEAQRTSPSLPPSEEDDLDPGGPKAYGFRSRQGQPANYNEIAAFEQMEQNGMAVKKKSKTKKTKMNWTGKDYENAWGPLPGQSDSDSDIMKTAQKAGIVPGTPGNGGMLAGGAGLPLDLAGTPSNLGRIGEAGLADADPLGVNVNVSFDDVGGLDDHVSKLKEMTLLPLLYPDMFQSLGVTPPRGVLFHGPPGTGKTLVARALAASCRSEGRSVSFFMRKGADCLSKWVGEAERQLRLLFEEAKKVQPSIIFFDEIDGLAPVRSSKQDQIHASIVSTLLALMDGMDGRGQVIVIGATNRPDAIDPALRRPGRFDREFYFPLPNFDARLKILEIMTKQWENWKEEKGEESRKRLAKLTKGYGGADLRALCTEAALNAIQRQYPQIYQSSERLLLDHSKIEVQARDFMISVKEVVPSSARSTASAAAPLPPQLEPLLQGPLSEVKDALDRNLPKSKKRSALEEAQWEEDHPDGEAGAFEREMMLQTLESQRINRPRLLLYGPSGMGQRAVGAAALHHLEGYSVQSFDLGTLTGDSARTPETAIVQLFIEAKRHAPSIIYIPSLLALCGSLPETCRALVADSLESLEPHEPILLLAILAGSMKDVPRDVRAWFGKTSGSRVCFAAPNEEKRRVFFQELIDYVKKPPSQFPDAVKRRRRVLEVLPIAPPLPPREPSAAELAAQDQQDTVLFYKLKSHLNSIYAQCRKADSKFCRATIDQTVGDIQTEDGIWWGKPRLLPPKDPNVQADPTDPATAVPAAPGEAAALAPVYGRNRLHNIDMARIHDWLWEGRYRTSAEFLRAVRLVRENAEMEKRDEDMDSKDMFRRADKVYGVAQEEVGRTEPMFNLETERMAARFKEKERKAREAREKTKLEEEAKSNAITKSGAENGAEDSVMATDGAEDRPGLKRTRNMDGANDSDGTGPPSKRPRTSPFDESNAEKAVRFDLPEMPSIAVNGNSVPDSDMADAFDPPSPSPNGPRSSNTSLAPTKDVAPSGLTQQVIRAISRSPSPGVSTPPHFNASTGLLDQLETMLVQKTANLDVEQLEALRALCLNLVWGHRSDWDRDNLIGLMKESITKYLNEIGEVSDDDD